MDPSLPCAVLQYSDDTLVVLKSDLNAISKLKDILELFASLSRLHINFSKSTLVPIHIDEGMILQCVQTIGSAEEKAFLYPTWVCPCQLTSFQSQRSSRTFKNQTST